MKMEKYSNCSFGGERPLFASHGVILDHVTFTAGESALKCCTDVHADGCVFQGKYPLWHTHRFSIDNCVFESGARAALWYSTGCRMTDTLVEAPKMFREMQDLKLSGVRMPDAQETLWHCTDVELDDVSVENADYLFMHSANIRIRNYRQRGNYSFQYCRDVTIGDADIHSKDAFWGTENVTVRNSTLIGEYLGWHSHNLTLIGCRIGGTQPLCYCRHLRLVDCTFDADADLAFEDSDVVAEIRGAVTSIKNPRTGRITLDSLGEYIHNGDCLEPDDAVIEIRK